MGGTMRLGAQPCVLEEGSQAKACYQLNEISGRHRHRYEFNHVYRSQFAAHGMTVSGTSPDGLLPEIVEIPEHPWFVAVQFHPNSNRSQQNHTLFSQGSSRRQSIVVLREETAVQTNRSMKKWKRWT